MRRLWLAFLLATFVLSALAAHGMRAADAPAVERLRPLSRHLSVIMLHMDRGPRSREYRESVAYLRLHPDETLAEISGFLLDEPGSFGKWQATYLLGEFGEQSAIALLRRLIEAPLPEARTVSPGSHEIDLEYTEELGSRFQAVASMARIATLRPELRDQVIETLIAVSQDAPMLEDRAMFELQRLLGPEFQSLRRHFGPEDAHYFEPFMPPPHWQGLLSRRMQKHQRQEQSLREKREPLCRAD